jgi:hypothetical protein
VLAARARLHLALAAKKFPRSTQRDISSNDFTEVRVGDVLSGAIDIVNAASHVVLNPPYSTIRGNFAWAAGSMNSASLFTYSSLEQMRPGSHMVAILPDVLRSGSRYSRWRDGIESMATVHKITDWGQFDNITDVHVFIIHLTKTRRGPLPPSTRTKLRISSLAVSTNCESDLALSTVSDFFKVTVGAVVQHRHPEDGLLRPFATARLLPAWQTVCKVPSKRRFTGRCATPPFVAVRRTSRPGQAPRAIATVVSGTEAVAVDNHLIVLHPYDGTESRCQELLALLRTPSTTQWLDEHFQCRHLTVQALENLPWHL